MTGTRKLTIGFVLDDSLDSTDGVQQYVLTVAEWLEKQGHECHFLVGESKRQDLNNVHSMSKVMRVRFNKNHMSTPLLTTKSSLEKVFARHKFDVLHVQLPYSPLLAGRIIRAAPASTAIVGTFHILPFGSMHRRANQALSRVLQRSLASFTAIASVSASAQKFARQIYKISSDVIPNTINMQRFAAKRPLQNEDKKRIVFLGRLVERKGARELLAALVMLQESHPKLARQVECVIGGKGKQLSKLQDYARRNNIEHMITFKGFIPEDEKATLLKSADIAVFPSLGGESFGIVLLEAMAAGSTVVIGGDNPGYRCVLGDQPSQLVKPKDTKMFTQVLKKYLLDTSAINEAHRWQQRTVRKYDVDFIGPKLLSWYQQAISDKSQKDKS